MAITAWSAKVCSSSTCLSRETRRACGRVTLIAPISSSFAQQRHTRWLRKPRIARHLRESRAISASCVNIGDLQLMSHASRTARSRCDPDERPRKATCAASCSADCPREGIMSRRRRSRLSTCVDKPHRTAGRRCSTIASNTGCTSDGELAITFRISAVAVCRSSASCVSLNSRAFSMAITAWSAKVCSNWT